jgi:hypothetical protein
LPKLKSSWIPIKKYEDISSLFYMSKKFEYAVGLNNADPT